MASVEVTEFVPNPDASGMVVRDAAQVGQSQSITGKPGLLGADECNPTADDLGAVAGEAVFRSSDERGRRLVVSHPNFAFQQETFTVAANGTTVDISIRPCLYWALQVTGTGAAATAWDVRLEVSLDGVGWTGIIQHTQTDLNGITKNLGLATIGAPGRFFRIRLNSITLGSATNVVCRAIGISG